ncbi:MAG: MFS transporter [Sphingomonadaceae bacterium]|nr:MFS transporter [Sphingomonadaceae bacterium]
MQISPSLVLTRRFGPLFATQMLGAFNDNLFKTVMVLFVTYAVFDNPAIETQFNAIATGLFILPFFLLSALSGQLADTRDKAKIVRLVKTAEILIMLVGATGIMLSSIALMLSAVFAMGIHSTFFGPIKYALLPQHLAPEEVLGGTGLVEAGTYIAILGGTLLAGLIYDLKAVSAAAVLLIAGIGWVSARFVPPAPPILVDGRAPPIDFHVVRSSWRLVSETMHIRRLFLAIIAISFFWAIGSVLIVEFPPLVKNTLTADGRVASLFLGIFSVGIAIGSIVINRLLAGRVSARFAPPAVILMGGFVILLYFVAASWDRLPGEQLYSFGAFMAHPGAPLLIVSLLGVAVCGGAFVVPLYAFITTTVPKDRTARTVAANNIVNSGAMVLGSLVMMGLSAVGVSVTDALLVVSVMCVFSAWIAWRLHKACDGPLATPLASMAE